MTARIVLFGATGYTGARHGGGAGRPRRRPVLAGRDPPGSAGWPSGSAAVETGAADVTDPRLGARPARPRRRAGHHGRARSCGSGEAGGRRPPSTPARSTWTRPVSRRSSAGSSRRTAGGPSATGAALLPAFGLDYVPGEAGRRPWPSPRPASGRTGSTSATACDGASGQAFSRGTLVSLVGVLFEPGFACHGGRLVAETAGRRGVARSRSAGRSRRGLSVGGSEHLTTARPRADAARGRRAPGLVRPAHPGRRTGWPRSPAWLGPAARRAAGLARLADAGRPPGRPRRRRGHAGAGAHPHGRRGARRGRRPGRAGSQLAGPGGVRRSPPTCWPGRGAGRRAAGVRGTGALGPVQAFGLGRAHRRRGRRPGSSGHDRPSPASTSAPPTPRPRWSTCPRGTLLATRAGADHARRRRRPACWPRRRGSATRPVLACSSAGGGLRLAVVGYEELISAEAGHRAALSAGARVVHVAAGRLDDGGARPRCATVAPDVVLLVGGTDGGEASVLRHNARGAGAGRSCGRPGRAGRQRRRPGRGGARVLRGRRPAGARGGQRAARHRPAGPGVGAGGDPRGVPRARDRRRPAVDRPAAAAVGAGGDAGRRAGGRLGAGRAAAGAEVPGVVVLDVGGATTDVYCVPDPDAEQATLGREAVGVPARRRTVEGDLGVSTASTTCARRPRPRG